MKAVRLLLWFAELDTHFTEGDIHTADSTRKFVCVCAEKKHCKVLKINLKPKKEVRIFSSE